VGNDTLPNTIAIFDSTEFLNLQGMNWSGPAILHVWKNMICVMGNINEIQVSVACVLVSREQDICEITMRCFHSEPVYSRYGHELPGGYLGYSSLGESMSTIQRKYHAGTV
jgi:hypothetical protein